MSDEDGRTAELESKQDFERYTDFAMRMFIDRREEGNIK